MPFSPSSLCPTPSPAGQSSGGHQDFIQSWHLQLETPPILCGQITKLLDFQLFPVCNRPLVTSPQELLPITVGRRCRQLTAQEVGSPSPALTLELALAWDLRLTQGKAWVSSPEAPRLSAAGFHIVPWEESSPL